MPISGSVDPSDLKLVAYLSHPIGDASDLVTRHDNLSDAGEWLRLIVRNTSLAVLCPWLAYINSVGDELYGPRALVDQLMILQRCDVVVQVAHVSPHMGIERNWAVRNDQPIVDLTGQGHPGQNDESIVASLRAQLTHAQLTIAPRKIWMPPLDVEDVRALRAAQELLAASPDHADAADVVRRITLAAMRGRKEIG